MRIRETDDEITVLGKKAAMISMYANHNPLHCFFEDGNVVGGPLTHERDANERRREVNGDRLYEFIKDFLDEFEPLDLADRRAVYRMYKVKEAYLWKKWEKKLRSFEDPSQPKDSGLAWRQFLDEDGHIYIQAFNGPKMLAF